MGHLVGKGIYRKLGKKIDQLAMRAPWNATFHAVLKELYTREEADLIVRMPYGLSEIETLGKITKIEESRLKKLLDGLCKKGLVLDLYIEGIYRYAPSPIVIGIFEFTMMRTGSDVDLKTISELFHRYLLGRETFQAANFKKGERISPMRILPHETAVAADEYVEILDYEKAAAIIESHDKFSIGICSCRHEKHHLGTRGCDVPLEVCSSFGYSADYLIRNNLSKEVSKTEMLEHLSRSQERGLVLNTDNVKNSVGFMCHCCKCCCSVLLGIRKFGYPNIMVTSNFIALIDPEECSGCGLCVAACPIDAIEVEAPDPSAPKKKKPPRVDETLCLGCGVCALKCKKGALKLHRREQRVFYPETSFERVILQCLERGTLQYQLFDNPGSIGQKILRAFVGGFLRLPPVKKALLSDLLRSRFLGVMKAGAGKLGKGWAVDL
ncbi:MAG: 4Fe-4S binding protein [Candidatus Aminicenantes bacterium]|nr:4Fe-4S binding protein [Candidatus Aminicenantes bacterium]